MFIVAVSNTNLFRTKTYVLLGYVKSYMV